MRGIVIASATVLSFWLVDTAKSQIGGQYYSYGPQIGSYNYYVGGGASGGIVAQMYPCPRPTPPFVGHTYITYEPLAPHNFLYRHSRTYSRQFGYGSSNTTRVIWW